MDLFSKFNSEYGDLVKDAVTLFRYLSESFKDPDDDLKRLRTLHTDFVTLRDYFTKKNDKVTSPTERSSLEMFYERDAFGTFIIDKTDPFIGMCQFLIELYEDTK